MYGTCGDAILRVASRPGVNTKRDLERSEGPRANALMLCSAEGKSGFNGFPGTGYRKVVLAVVLPSTGTEQDLVGSGTPTRGRARPE